MKSYFYLLFLLVLAISSSCNKLEEGTVTEMWYEPQRTYVQMMPVMISNGKTMTTTFIPYFVTDNEDYVIKVTGLYNGKERVEQVYVSPSCYHELEIGSNWKLDERCSFSDTNNSKERE